MLKCYKRIHVGSNANYVCSIINRSLSAAKWTLTFSTSLLLRFSSQILIKYNRFLSKKCLIWYTRFTFQRQSSTNLISHWSSVTIYFSSRWSLSFSLIFGVKIWMVKVPFTFWHKQNAAFMLIDSVHILNRYHHHHFSLRSSPLLNLGIPWFTSWRVESSLQPAASRN